MSRHLLGCTIAILLLPSLTRAQNPIGPPQVIPVRPVMTTPLPGRTAVFVGAVAGGGPQTPYLDLSSGRIASPTVFYAAPWPGGFLTPNGLYVPYGVAVGELRLNSPAPVLIPRTSLPQRSVALSGEYPATLTLEFPAAAKVWLDDQPVAGGARKEQVLTSPVLAPGQRYTFNVRAEWDAGGKMYEHTRQVTLEHGDRKKLLVVSGSLITDNKKR